LIIIAFPNPAKESNLARNNICGIPPQIASYHLFLMSRLENFLKLCVGTILGFVLLVPAIFILKKQTKRRHFAAVALYMQTIAKTIKNTTTCKSGIEDFAVKCLAAFIIGIVAYVILLLSAWVIEKILGTLQRRPEEQNEDPMDTTLIRFACAVAAAAAIIEIFEAQLKCVLDGIEISRILFGR
jgi:hypothetical protein